MLKIKENYFKNIINSIENGTFNFDAEGGCACGRLAIKLSDQLYLCVYRSCRKSNSTPDDKFWNIDSVKFYDKPFDELAEDYPNSVKMKLDKTQEAELIGLLKEATNKAWGEEYR